MRWTSIVTITLLVSLPPGVAWADELTQIVQQDLTSLGYDTGGTDGTVTTKTIIAVSRFQSEHNLEATGEITPQLAGVIKAAMSRGDSAGKVAQPAVATSTPATAPGDNGADLRARQQACLQERAAAAQRSAELKRGLGKLLSAVSRTSSRYGSGDAASAISTTTGDVNSASATVNDLEGAAQDLGLSQSDVDACRNP